MPGLFSHRDNRRTLLSSRERSRGAGAWLLVGFGVLFSMLALLTLVPLLWMLLASLRPASELFVQPARLIPARFDFSAYGAALFRMDYWRLLGNSLVAATGAVLIQLMLSAMAAYAISVLKPKTGRMIFLMMLATLLIPFETVAVPLFLQMRAFPFGQLGWPHVNLISSTSGLVLPFLVSAFNIYILKAFFDRIPADLFHAARLDGASETRIFFSMVLPLARPVLSILAIFSFITVWNAFFWPLIVLTDPKQYTLMLGVQKLIEGGEPWNVVMAAVALVTLPTILVFLFLRRWIERGVAFTSLQG
jgi:multiple sugar transport system permease protein